MHVIAGTLVWPVLIGLLALLAVMLVLLGRFAREAWDRSRGTKRALERDLSGLESSLFIAGEDTVDLRLESALQAAERQRWREVNRLRLAVRVGPSLGLMGTLIPMANALQGLAEGNLPALASNMVTAFAATVIGLGISVVAYLMSATRENWVRADIEALAFQAERLSRGATVTAAARQLSRV
jgi:biopolymer transport protein ExbB/TolQ